MGISWIACFFKFSSGDPGTHFVFVLLKSGRGCFAIFAVDFFFFFLIKSKGTCKSFTSLLFSFYCFFFFLR